MPDTRRLIQPPDDAAYGVRIAAEREAIGMTQTLLAELSGMQRDHLNKVEHGHRRLQADELARVAAVLGLSPSDLQSGPPAMQFRTRTFGPETEAAIEVFNRFIHNCELIETLKAFDAD